MLGVSLITHFVTYPSFKLIKSSIFPVFHKSYTSKMLLIVAPIMILELISSILLVIFDVYDNDTEIALLITLILIWFLTFFTIVPIHNKLAVNYNKDLNQKFTGLHSFSCNGNIGVVDIRIAKFNPIAVIIKLLRRLRKYGS